MTVQKTNRKNNGRKQEHRKKTSVQKNTRKKHVQKTNRKNNGRKQACRKQFK